MKYWRNPEIKKELAVYIIISAAFVIAAYVICRAHGAAKEPAVWTGIAGTVYSMVHFMSSYIRYARIRKLSDDIDSILHNGYNMQFADYKEGELSILADEVHKTLLRLAETEDKLKKDKQGLADSLADISHQLRTPLTSLNLLAERINGSSDEDRRTVLELKLLLKRIDWLVEALLKISRLDSGTVEFRKDKIKADDLIDKAYEPLSISMELKGISFHVETHGEDITGDMIWNSEALGNIIKNCMEHTPEGGSISVSVNETEIYTEIIVKDTGNGIAEEDLPHIFERFYRGDGASENSFGIGLALSRMIIKSQNGTVKASNYKDGACFSIKFYKAVV